MFSFFAPFHWKYFLPRPWSAIAFHKPAVTSRLQTLHLKYPCSSSGNLSFQESIVSPLHLLTPYWYLSLSHYIFFPSIHASIAPLVSDSESSGELNYWMYASNLRLPTWEMISKSAYSHQPLLSHFKNCNYLLEFQGVTAGLNHFYMYIEAYV